MPFISDDRNERFYNNADSFAMAFDDAWKKYSSSSEEVIEDKDEKLKKILGKVKNHPFMQNNPEKARDIANFRLKLLNLS